MQELLTPCLVQVHIRPCLEATGDTLIGGEPPQCLMMQPFDLELDFPRRPHYHATHWHPGFV